MEPVDSPKDVRKPPESDVSVVICASTERRFNMLCGAIASVQRQETKVREIIVVIDYNASLLRRIGATFPEIRVFPNSETQGYPGARNTGARAARGDIVAFLDDDAVAATDWTQRLTEVFSSPDVLGGGGAVIPRWPNEAAPRWFPDEFLWVVGCSYRGLPVYLTSVRNPIGANMAIKRSVIDELQGFREDMSPVDETEFCVRATQRWPAGLWMLSPEPQVEHVVLPERCRMRYFFWRCYREGVAKAKLRKYVGRRDALASERTYMLRVLPAAIARGLADTARGDPWGTARAFSIFSGLGATAAGYARGRLDAATGDRFARERRYVYSPETTRASSK
jgi:glycosyltransferase involved in cell wall biosynthesis